ncbi:hypothetical protein LINPERHAP2_LOCUS36990 [Linum perenne]
MQVKSFSSFFLLLCFTERSVKFECNCLYLFFLSIDFVLLKSTRLQWEAGYVHRNGEEKHQNTITKICSR